MNMVRPLARVFLLLIAVMSVLAWSATTLLGTTARAWFERDLAARARLTVNAARRALVAGIVLGDTAGVAALVNEIGGADHVVAAEACNAGGATLALTGVLPAPFGCGALQAGSALGSRAPAQEAHFPDVVGGEPVRVSVLPLRDGDALVGRLVLVHDMRVAAHRVESLRRMSLATFAVLAGLAAALVVLLQRVSCRWWTHELRRLLILGRGARAERLWRGPFQPLLGELRRMASDLASEQQPSVGGGAWSAERLQQVVERSLGGEGVVVVANRAPYIHERTPEGGVKVLHPASGLVTALEPVMRACSGTWIAHGSGSADRATVDRHGRVRVPPGVESYSLRRVWLSSEEERGYYYGFSNEGLWPLCHMADARPIFRADDWRHYQAVNERFADAVGDEVGVPDPIVLVQDYHVALAPEMIRKRLPRAAVLAFWHIPWPNAERFGMCPWGRELLKGLLGSSVIGFHTQLHCNNFIESVERYLEARIDREQQAVVIGGRTSLVRSYPISVAWPNHEAEAAPPAEACRRDVRAELGLASDALLGVGVDRLDYTKGIEERLLAVERLLERFPHLRGRFTFAQLAAPSRTVLESYRTLAARVEAVAARVNQRFGAGAYRPVALLRAHHEAPAVFRYLRAADVCYVSSLHDGMNLVAKEFVAARADERGVLVLSRFTGAARELREALVVNPYDLEEASAALAAALTMPAREQADRMSAMRRTVAERNVYRWAGQMLMDAARVRQRGRLSGRLSDPVPGTSEEAHA